MKILQVSTVDIGGGAEKVAWDLHHAYRARGHESFLVVGHKRSGDPHTFELGWTWSKDHLLRRLRSGEDVGLQGFHHPASHHIQALVGQPWDVAHLHNLHGRYFDLAALPALAAQAPTVIQLQDMWMLTGHCAHTFACQRWREGCGSCPNLTTYPAARFDFTKRNLARKQRFMPQPGMLASSGGSWLLDLLDESYLADLPRKHVVNPIDTKIFCPGDQGTARDALGLPRDRPILLFPAPLTDPPSSFKAQDMFLDTVRQLASEGVLGVAFGDAPSASTAGLGDALRLLPSSNDVDKIADRYRAADVVVLPSRADTSPLAIMEAMACGRAVVATRVGGIPELVTEGATGSLVDVDDTAALAAACRTLLAEDARRAAYGEAAATLARAFDIDVVAQEWLDTYAEMIAERNAGPPGLG